MSRRERPAWPSHGKATPGVRDRARGTGGLGEDQCEPALFQHIARHVAGPRLGVTPRPALLRHLGLDGTGGL